MTRLERLALLAVLGLLLAALVMLAPVAGGLGGTTGAALGLLSARRLTGLSRRMDAVIGSGDVRSGFRARTVLWRVCVQVSLLGAVFLSVGLLPFVGDELFAGAGALVTALPAVVTAVGLRPGRT